MREESEDMDFTVVSPSRDDDLVIVTSTQKMLDEKIKAAVEQSMSGNVYSAVLNDDRSSGLSLTLDMIDQLAENPQDNLEKILKINRIVHKYENKDDIIGLVGAAIRANVNTQYRLSYKGDAIKGRNKLARLKDAKELIEKFNQQINVKSIIRQSVPSTYFDGTYVMYLRHEDGGYVVDVYPLGVAVIAPYKYNGDSIAMIDMDELISRLRKIIPRDRKNKALFFDNLKKELESNYPKEVYDAYIAKDRYAKLNVSYTGVMKIGDWGKSYGVSQVFRALKSAMMLDTFAKADSTVSRIRAKKILHQVMRKETMGVEWKKDGLDRTIYAHQEMSKALKSGETVAYTSPPQVESLKYVEIDGKLTDKESINNYRTQGLTTLGIGFLATGDSTSSLSAANMSLSQLLRVINSISESLEHILEKWYRAILAENGIDEDMAPTVQIIDSEQMEMGIRKDLATALFGTMNASYETAYGLLGIDVRDEVAKRKAENEAGYDKVFAPRITAYTNTGNTGTENDGGRPVDEEPDANVVKQDYDKNYNKTRS